jgi:prepilin-type N-terminal cleavage/methylation domain-containing protein
MKNPTRAPEAGYSLAEMLVVVAIIGVMSLVAVPQFMTFYRQSKMRSAVRQFTADIRATRQRAISKNNLTVISFTMGATPASPGVRGQYAIYDFNGWDFSTDPDTRRWRRVGQPRKLDEAVYFLPSSFANNVVGDDDDKLDDIAFKADGTIVNLPGTPTVVLKTDYKVPNNRCTLTMQSSGAFSSALTSE